MYDTSDCKGCCKVARLAVKISIGKKIQFLNHIGRRKEGKTTASAEEKF